MAGERPRVQLVAVIFDGDAFRRILAWVMEPADLESRQRRGAIAKAELDRALRAVDSAAVNDTFSQTPIASGRAVAWPPTTFMEN